MFLHLTLTAHGRCTHVFVLVTENVPTNDILNGKFNNNTTGEKKKNNDNKINKYCVLFCFFLIGI